MAESDSKRDGHKTTLNNSTVNANHRSTPTAPNNNRVVLTSRPAISGHNVHNGDRALGVVTPPPPPPVGRDSAARDRMRRRRVQGRRQGGEWAWVVIALALIGVVVTISLVLFLVLRMSRTAQEITPTAEVSIAALPTPVDFRSAQVSGKGAALTLGDGRSVVLEPWDGQSRLTVLLMGLDRRPGETGLAYRTDTMMILSLNPENGDVGILSIPRDTYIEVPGYSGARRINEAMVLGELNQTGSGPILAKETVQYNFAIRINHYIVVDFNAFIQIVDAIGGIEVDLDYNISDPYYPSMNYGYDPFNLRAGHHVLDGATALKFARTRHGDNDIKRGERQQQVLFAIMDKVSDPANLPRVLSQTPTIWNAIRENFYTDLTFEQMISLGLYVKDVPRENIKTATIGFEYLRSWTTPAGASVLIPNRTKIGDLMAQVFGPNYSQ